MLGRETAKMVSRTCRKGVRAGMGTVMGVGVRKVVKMMMTIVRRRRKMGANKG